MCGILLIIISRFQLAGFYESYIIINTTIKNEYMHEEKVTGMDFQWTGYCTT